MATQKKVDAVTVGAGWTAAVYAQKLTAAGHHVVSLEQGPIRWTNPDFEHNHDPLLPRLARTYISAAISKRQARLRRCRSPEISY